MPLQFIRLYTKINYLVNLNLDLVALCDKIVEIMIKPSLIEYIEKNNLNSLVDINFSNFNTNAVNEHGITALHYIAKKYQNKKFKINQEQLDYLLGCNIFDNNYQYAKRGGVDLCSSLIILVRNEQELNLSEQQWSYLLDKSSGLFALNLPNIHPLHVLITCLPVKGFTLDHFKFVLEKSEITRNDKRCHDKIITYVKMDKKDIIKSLIYNEIFNEKNTNEELIYGTLAQVNKIAQYDNIDNFLSLIEEKNFFISHVINKASDHPYLMRLPAIESMQERYYLDRSVKPQTDKKVTKI